jgi:hypothetical protein
MRERDNEIRLSLRAAVALFVVPQVCMVAALSALFLGERDRAAPLRERGQAQAEEVPQAVAKTALPASNTAAPAPGETFPMARLLEAIVATGLQREPTATPPKVAVESRAALGTRLREELEGGFAALEALETPERPEFSGTGRLEEVRSLVGELEALTASFASLRSGGGGRGGAGGALGRMGSLGGMGEALAQVMPLLEAVQELREGRLGEDPAMLDSLDRFLGRDEERPRRLGLLVLLAWALDGDADA